MPYNGASNGSGGGGGGGGGVSVSLASSSISSSLNAASVSVIGTGGNSNQTICVGSVGGANSGFVCSLSSSGYCNVCLASVEKCHSNTGSRKSRKSFSSRSKMSHSNSSSMRGSSGSSCRSSGAVCMYDVVSCKSISPGSYSMNALNVDFSSYMATHQWSKMLECAEFVGAK